MLTTSTSDSLQEQPQNDNRTDNIQQCPQIKRQQLQLKYMNVCVINCCSIKNKLTYVLDHLNEHKSDIVAITESWLSSDEGKNRTVSQECADYDYKLFHIPRPNRKGGGVALLIKNGLNVIKQVHSIRQSFEHVELLITAFSIHLRIVVIYRPPQSKHNSLTNNNNNNNNSLFQTFVHIHNKNIIIRNTYIQ